MMLLVVMAIYTLYLMLNRVQSNDIYTYNYVQKHRYDIDVDLELANIE